MPLAQKCIKCGHVVTWNSDLLDKCPACNDRMWSLTPGNVDPDQRLRHWLGDVYDRPTVGARGSNYYNHGSAYFARRPATAGAGWFNAPHPDHRFGASYSTAAVRESAPLAGRLFAREPGDQGMGVVERQPSTVRDMRNDHRETERRYTGYYSPKTGFVPLRRK
jgi:predicted  nucleic acid-binding Zn-ribbon protein